MTDDYVFTMTLPFHITYIFLFNIVAMGKIGVVNEEITETLLWAVRYEEKAGVRAEACHTLMMLKLKTEEVAEVLQERFLVESSNVVRE